MEINRRTRRAMSVAVMATSAMLMAGVGLAAPTLADPASGRTSAEDAQASLRQRIPRVVERWAAAWNAGDAQAMASLFTEDGVYRDNAFQTTFEGRDGVATWVEITAASIRDPHVEVADAVRTGNRIAVRWTFSGTDTGAFAPDMPSAGASFAVPAVSVFELRGGLIERVEDYYNLADLLRQLGLPAGVYEPPPAG